MQNKINQPTNTGEHLPGNLENGSVNIASIPFIKENGILRLIPTLEQWVDFGTLITFVSAYGAEEIGIFIDQMPKEVAHLGPVTPLPPARLTASRFKSVRQSDGTFLLYRRESKIMFPTKVRSCENRRLVDFSKDGIAVERFQEELKQDTCFESVLLR